MMRMKLSTPIINLSNTSTVTTNSTKSDYHHDETKVSTSPNSIIKMVTTTTATTGTSDTITPRVKTLRSFSSCPSTTTAAAAAAASTELSSSNPILNSAIKSTSLDLENCLHSQQPNELIIIDQNQTIAIEVPPNTLKIDLHSFRPASELHPEPGDIIEFDRTLFSQWGIYVGDGDVVVIVGNDAIQMVPDSEIAHVELVPLTIVAGDHYCRVNNKLHRAKERNLLPFNNEIVVRKALSKVCVCDTI